MASATHRSARPAKGPEPASDDESRALFQQRLALIAKAWAATALSSYLLANLVSSFQPGYRWTQLVTHLASRLVLGASAVYVLQWLVCRRGRLAEGTLVAIDTLSTTLVAACSAAMVFATFPGELAGLSYARALLLVTFGLVGRAVVVPSTARRTLLLGLLATGFGVAASAAWFGSQGIRGASPVIHTAVLYTGAVTVSTLASQVIFGLRQRVREAWQLGQYTLLEKIGEGGMGAVYRASHAMLRRPTAIKLLPPERAGAEHLRRFEREVQLTSRLAHPNTVAIFDYGRTSDGVFYYAMEYLAGVNLEDLVQADGPQPAGRVIHVLRQVAGSLAEAHGIGLIHRDIKPANVILVPERGGALDVAKVVDFGLVKDVDQAVDVTSAGQMAGTPLYFSPEAITSPEQVDARSDLYSLGCVGYYLVTGHRVFGGRTLGELCGHHLHSRPVPPAERLGKPVPGSLAALLMACLEKDAARRPSSARALLGALDACTDVAPWTEDLARAWWGEQGARILERARGSAAEAAAREGTPALATSVGTSAAFIRPADHPEP